MDAEVGAAGRAGDNGVLKSAWLMEQLVEHREAWLGKNGLVAADGGASDGGELLLNPIPNASSEIDCWYNFCHSSTRFYVEETFGRWKNRARFLLYQLDCSHKIAVRTGAHARGRARDTIFSPRCFSTPLPTFSQYPHRC